MKQPDNTLLFIMALSCALQFLAAFMSIRLIRPSGAYIAWLFLACGFIIQGVRRLVSLVYVLNGKFQGELTVELLGLAISFLMLFGILKFEPLFQKINNSKNLLLQQKEKLKKANSELEAFVSSASHDLRTPLSVIIGYTDYLKETVLKRPDEQILTCIKEMEGQATRMEALLEDLLALARVGYVKRPEEATDPNKVVKDVIVEINTQLVNKQVRVETTLLPKIHIPETLLSEVFKNLIANALYYGCKEGDTIEIGGEEGPGTALYYVRDHGPGIPEEERGQIFDMFYRGASGSTKKGTGIGLAIAKKIVGLYGGRIWIEGSPQGGSTFWFELSDREP